MRNFASIFDPTHTLVSKRRQISEDLLEFISVDDWPTSFPNLVQFGPSEKSYVGRGSNEKKGKFVTDSAANYPILC